MSTDRSTFIRFATTVSLVFALGLLLSLQRGTHAAEPHDHALKNYVERPDDSYGWQLRQRSRLGRSDCIELTLTSQTWKDILWQHRLFLIVPDGVEGETDAVLVVEGGRWKESFAQPVADGQPDYPREAHLLAGLAQQLKAPLAIVLNVPQQPVFNGKTEDAIIAYTFDHFLETGDSDWPLLLPMVKSAVKAMDAVQDFAAEDRGLTINGFTVTGASKRGWTSWLTAAVDERIHALGPMVIDMLNLVDQLPHQFTSWGEYSKRIHDYTDIDLPNRIDSPRGQALVRIVDPYAYRHQITQPKVLFLGTNDGFWTLDALNLYWDGLQGPSHIVYVPNADHDLAMDWQRVFGGLKALHVQASGGQPLPSLNWQYQRDDDATRLTVEPGEPVVRVVLWTAESSSRDFRQATWSASPLAADADGTYIAELADPAAGYAAAYAEIVYPRPGLPLSLSTTIQVLPPKQTP